MSNTSPSRRWGALLAGSAVMLSTAVLGVAGVAQATTPDPDAECATPEAPVDLDKIADEAEAAAAIARQAADLAATTAENAKLVAEGLRSTADTAVTNSNAAAKAAADAEERVTAAATAVTAAHTAVDTARADGDLVALRAAEAAVTAAEEAVAALEAAAATAVDNKAAADALVVSTEQAMDVAVEAAVTAQEEADNAKTAADAAGEAAASAVGAVTLAEAEDPRDEVKIAELKGLRDIALGEAETANDSLGTANAALTTATGTKNTTTTAWNDAVAAQTANQKAIDDLATANSTLGQAQAGLTAADTPAATAAAAALATAQEGLTEAIAEQTAADAVDQDALKSAADTAKTAADKAAADATTAEEERDRLEAELDRLEAAAVAAEADAIAARALANGDTLLVQGGAAADATVSSVAGGADCDTDEGSGEGTGNDGGTGDTGGSTGPDTKVTIGAVRDAKAVVGTSSILVSWTAPADAAAVVGYEAFANPVGAQSNGQQISCITNAATFTCRLGVEAGRAYSVGVLGFDKAGIRGASAGFIETAAVPAPVKSATVPTGSATLKNSDGTTISNVVPGQKRTFTGEGYLPFSTVSLYVYSEPTFLGNVTADKDGRFTVEVTIPANLAVGNHSLVASGVDADGNPYVMRSDFTVGAAGAQSATLASTGASIALPLLGGLAAVGLGGGLVFTARRRSNA